MKSNQSIFLTYMFGSTLIIPSGVPNLFKLYSKMSNADIDDSEVSMLNGDPHKQPTELIKTIKKKKTTTVPKFTLDRVIFN